MESIRPKETAESFVTYWLTRLVMAIILLAISALLTSKNAIAKPQEPLWQIAAEPSWGSQAEVITSDSFDGGRFYNVVEKHKRHEYSAADSVSYFRYVYTIKNDSGLDDSAPITVEFDPIYERVQLHRVVVHRGGKAINQLNRENIQLLQRETQLESGLYDGNQTLHLLLSDQRVGDQVEYSYSIIGHNPVFDDHVFGWARLQANVPVGNYFFRLKYPEDIKVFTRTYAGEAAVEKTQEKGYRLLTWEQQNTTASEYQSDVPSSYLAQTYIQYTDFPSWPAVAMWGKPLFELNVESSNAVKQLANDIKSKWSSTDQQVEAAIGFVQDKIRYTGINTGIGGFKPDSPEQILHRRYGDCKDKAVLLVALLREFGVTAYPALVHSYDGDAIGNYLPSPDAFNHMIVKFPDYNGKNYWVDGTMTLQGSKLDSLYQRGYQHALIPAQGDQGLQAYTTKTLELPSKEVLEQYALQHNAESSDTELTITTIYRSHEAESMRRSIQSEGKRKLQSHYLNYYENRFDIVDIKKPIEVIDDRQANTLTIIEHYLVDDAWERSEEYSDEKSTWYYLNVHADTITAQLSVPSDRRRYQPLVQNYPVNVTHQIELTTVEGWDIDDDTDDFENDYFIYESSASVTGTTLVLKYSLVTLDDVVTVADSKRYIKELKKTLDAPYYDVWFELPVVSENMQHLSNQLSDIGSWFNQTVEILSSTGY